MIPICSNHACCYHCTYGPNFLLRKAGLFTKTEDDIELKEEFAAQEEAEFASHTATPTVLAESAEVVSPLAGQVKPLSQATDPVFSVRCHGTRG